MSNKLRSILERATFLVLPDWLNAKKSPLETVVSAVSALTSKDIVTVPLDSLLESPDVALVEIVSMYPVRSETLAGVNVNVPLLYASDPPPDGLASFTMLNVLATA